MCLSGCKCEKIQNCFCWQSSKFSNNLRSNSLKPSGKKVFFLKMNYIPDSKRSWNALQNKSTTECCLSFDIYLIENSTKTICFRFLGFFGSTCLFWIWCQQHLSWGGSNKRSTWNTWNIQQANRLISNRCGYKRGTLESHSQARIGWGSTHCDTHEWHCVEAFLFLHTASQLFGNWGCKCARRKNGRKFYLLTNLRKRDAIFCFVCETWIKKIHLPAATICVWKFSRVQSWVWNTKGELYETE